jgi:hypothetical protein
VGRATHAGTSEARSPFRGNESFERTVARDMTSIGISARTAARRISCLERHSRRDLVVRVLEARRLLGEHKHDQVGPDLGERAANLIQCGFEFDGRLAERGDLDPMDRRVDTSPPSAAVRSAVAPEHVTPSTIVRRT